MYEITTAGRAALREWLLDGEAGHELRDLGLLKVFFASALDGEAVDVVRAFRRSRERLLERLREVEAALPAPARGSSGALVLEFGIGLNEWQVEWAKAAERRLAARRRRTA